MMRKIFNYLWIFLLVSVAHAQRRSCTTLAHLVLPPTQVISAQKIASGAFPPPANLPLRMPDAASLFKKLPAFCQVVAENRPSADSDIKIEVWMPAAGWNGRFQGQGNGGFAGEIDHRLMA